MRAFGVVDDVESLLQLLQALGDRLPGDRFDAESPHMGDELTDVPRRGGSAQPRCR